MEKGEIIRGISMFNPSEHADIGRYKTTVLDNEPAVYVIEISTGRAKHLGGKLIVFTRLISEKEHQRRERAYIKDPEQYLKEQLGSLC